MSDAATSPSQQGSPLGQILIGLLVPGLPQLRAGQAVRGAVAFLSVVVPFFVGVLALGPRYWFFAMVDTDEGSGGGVFGLLGSVTHVLGGAVFPESLALGPSIVASVMLRPDAAPAFERLERMPIAGEEWFAILTTVAGVLAALWAADAAWHATGRKRFDERAPAPALAAMAAWFVPGSATVWIGSAVGDDGLRKKGFLTGGAVVVLYLIGLVLSSGQAVDRGNHYVWWIGEAFAGLPLLVGAAISSVKLSALPWGYDLGIALCTTAGLINIILMVEAYTFAESGLPPAPDHATADEGTA